jgi:hypothetical protein
MNKILNIENKMSFKITLRGFLIAASFASTNLIATCDAGNLLSNETIAAGCCRLVCNASDVASMCASAFDAIGNQTNAPATPLSSWSTYTVNGLKNVASVFVPISSIITGVAAAANSSRSKFAAESAATGVYCHLGITAYHFGLLSATSDASIQSKADEEMMYSLLKTGGYFAANLLCLNIFNIKPENLSTKIGSALLIGLAINDFYNWNLKGYASVE